jgi:hypothetical protein
MARIDVLKTADRLNRICLAGFGLSFVLFTIASAGGQKDAAEGIGDIMMGCLVGLVVSLAIRLAPPTIEEIRTLMREGDMPKDQDLPKAVTTTPDKVVEKPVDG